MACEVAKRERKTNFSRDEEAALLQSYSASKDLLQGKLKQSLTVRDKRRAWQDVCSAVNAVNTGRHRSLDEVKGKWHRLASEAKKALAARRKPKTGGGPPPSIPWFTDLVGDILGQHSGVINGLSYGFDTGDNDDYEMQNHPPQGQASIPQPQELPPAEVLEPQGNSFNTNNGRGENEAVSILDLGQVDGDETIIVVHNAQQLNKEVVETAHHPQDEVPQACSTPVSVKRKRNPKNTDTLYQEFLMEKMRAMHDDREQKKLMRRNIILQNKKLRLEIEALESEKECRVREKENE